MMRCRRCKKEFDEPMTREWDDWSEYWGSLVVEHHSEERCPYCDSDKIESEEEENAE